MMIINHRHQRLSFGGAHLEGGLITIGKGLRWQFINTIKSAFNFIMIIGYAQDKYGLEALTYFQKSIID